MTEPVLRAPNRGAAGPAEPLGPTGEASGGRSTPGWAYGVLGVLVVTSAVLTVWRTGSSLELYYAAAVRSMTSSWHNLAFAAFDPRGTVTLDKLPGAFWLQALSARLFGIHPWALALPQVLEGLVSILLLFSTVRRLRGPGVALLASGILAVAPASTALDRGNISDSLLIVCLLAAARLLVAALERPSLLRAAWVGVLVGMAFQAKMVEAWLILPVLGLTYLVCAPVSFRRRALQLGALVAVGVIVSLSWMTAVSLVPRHDRPYVDGSAGDSVFEQVFDYNGFGRVGQPSPNQELARTLGLPVLDDPGPPAGILRLLTGPYARDVGWLLPAAVVSGAACLVRCRGRRRTDPFVVATVLFSSWLVTFGLFLSVTTSFNPYYLAVLDPAVAALVGSALVGAWSARHRLSGQLLAAALVVVTTVTAVHVLGGAGAAGPSGLEAAVVTLAAVALVALTVAGVRRITSPLVGAVVAGVVVTSLALVPTVASVWITADALGPFDTPFQPAAVTAFTKAFFSPTRDAVGLDKITAARLGAPDLFAAQTSALAAPYIFTTGDEVLPIGGFTGTIPEPTVARIRTLVASGAFHLVLAGSSTSDPRIAWVARHCRHLGAPSGGGIVPGAKPVLAYFCLPSDATG
jgi:4-amino-4-deoxy-L-arabinose transferase-like glycosyltransferase